MSSPALVPWLSQPQSIELHEPHAALDQPPRQQAVVGERDLARLGAVQVVNVLRLLAMSISSGTLVCMR